MIQPQEVSLMQKLRVQNRQIREVLTAGASKYGLGGFKSSSISNIMGSPLESDIVERRGGRLIVEQKRGW